MYKLPVKQINQTSGFDAVRLLNATKEWYLSCVRDSKILQSEIKWEFRIEDWGAYVCIFDSVQN